MFDGVPRQKCRQRPGAHADEESSGFRAGVAGLEGFADGVVPFEADGQDGEDRGMSNHHLDVGDGLT